MSGDWRPRRFHRPTFLGAGERKDLDAHRIIEKLNLHSVGELVRFAVRKGLVD